MATENLENLFDTTFAGIRQAREAFAPQLQLRETGTIISVATGIAKVSGMPGVGSDELAIFFTSIPGCWSGQRIYARNSEAARLPPCPLSRLKQKTFRPTFQPILFQSPMDRSTFHPPCSNSACCPRLMSVNSFHGLAAKRSAPPIGQWRETSSSAMSSLKNMRAFSDLLLELTAKLFDSVPLDQMKDAEHAVQEAAADIPQELLERLDTADKMSTEDRESILHIARESCARFQPKAESDPQTDDQPRVYQNGGTKLSEA